MTEIKEEDYLKMPWKNGMGVTEEIARFPKEDSFLWRLSRATVQVASPFSIYPGCTRWLAVWRGEGLMLNEKKLPPFEPICFSGEEKIYCVPIGEKVIDVGLIFDSQKISAEMKVVEGELDLKSGGLQLHFLYDLQTGNTFKIENSTRLVVAKSFLISIETRK